MTAFRDLGSSVEPAPVEARGHPHTFEVDVAGLRQKAAASRSPSRTARHRSAFGDAVCDCIELVGESFHGCLVPFGCSAGVFSDLGNLSTCGIRALSLDCLKPGHLLLQRLQRSAGRHMTRGSRVGWGRGPGGVPARNP